MIEAKNLTPEQRAVLAKTFRYMSENIISAGDDLAGYFAERADDMDRATDSDTLH